MFFLGYFREKSFPAQFRFSGAFEEDVSKPLVLTFWQENLFLKIERKPRLLEKGKLLFISSQGCRRFRFKVFQNYFKCNKRWGKVKSNSRDHFYIICFIDWRFYPKTLFVQSNKNLTSSIYVKVVNHDQVGENWKSKFNMRNETLRKIVCT